MNIAQLVLILAIVAFVIVRRFTGQPLRGRSGTLLIPLGLTAWAAYELATTPVTMADVGFLAICVLLGVASGAARGVTVRIYSRGGHLWSRYSPITLLVWVATIALRIGIVEGSRLLGAHLPSEPALVLTLGVSLLAEAGVVAARAARTGVPYAPRQSARAVAR